MKFSGDIKFERNIISIKSIIILFTRNYTIPPIWLDETIVHNHVRQVVYPIVEFSCKGKTRKYSFYKKHIELTSFSNYSSHTGFEKLVLSLIQGHVNSFPQNSSVNWYIWRDTVISLSSDILRRVNIECKKNKNISKLVKSVNKEKRQKSILNLNIAMHAAIENGLTKSDIMKSYNIMRDSLLVENVMKS